MRILFLILSLFITAFGEYSVREMLSAYNNKEYKKALGIS